MTGIYPNMAIHEMAQRIDGLSPAALCLTQSDFLAIFFAGMDFQRAITEAGFDPQPSEEAKTS